MNTLHVKKGDTVVVRSGVDKGKTGKVVKVLPALGLVVVEGVGVKHKHQRPRRPGEKGQVLDKQHPIAASKVALADEPKVKKSKK
ncbi:MAG: large subunit ribosomal protein [Patescibacteria group bacterium]|jgi:large subunit ribosomal protein L24|nr:large subunit ribosomal protein [Patescibacteria group bacterium]